MSDKRQKTKSQQMLLDFTAEGRDESSDDRSEGLASRAADSAIESPTSSDRLMERVCDPTTFNDAIAKVVTNDGAPAVDGMNVSQLGKYFQLHRPRIIAELLSGTYRPKPAKRVEIPKPDGGVRKLGIPSAVDRVIQQAILLVLTPYLGRNVLRQQFRLPASSKCS